MSELIDRIFDAEKISKEVATILSELNKVKTNIEVFTGTIDNLTAATRKAKGFDDLSKNAKSLNDTVVKGSEEMKRWEAEVQKLKEKTEQLTTTEKAAAIEIAKARLEMQAATKANKEAAIAEIEATAATKGLTGSYNELQKDLTKSIKAYKDLSEAERNGATGKEMLKKINETQKTLKDTDAAMGNYQRNVGNYSESFKPLMGTFEKLMKTQSNVKGNAADLMGFFSGSKSGFEIFQKGVGLSDESLKVLSKNPILAIISILIGLFNAVKDSISSSSKATNTLKEAMAPLNAAMTVAKNATVAILQVFLDSFLAVSKFTTAIYALISGNDKYSKSVQDAAKVEKERQAISKANRELLVSEAKDNLEIAKLRDKVTEKDKYSRAERNQALKDAIKLEKKISDEKLSLSIREYNNLVKQLRSKKELNGDEKQQLADAQAKMYNVQTDYYKAVRRMRTQSATFNKQEDEEALKAKEDAAKAQKEFNDKIIAAQRRLTDSKLALMKDSEEKSLAISNETFNRQISDLRRNGELTKELLKNLTNAQENEVDKIKNEWKSKNLQEQIKSDELILDNMKKAGNDTLTFEKELLKKRMEAEILAGGDKAEIQKKYKFLELDLEAKTADEKIAVFEKELKKQSELLTNGYSEQEKQLKKRYANGKIDKEKYEKELSEIQLNALLETNNQTIAALEKQLEISGLSDDKKSELSNKLTALKIANENAVTDATIKANEDRVKADEDAKAKRVEVAKALISATTEIFGAIADYQTQQSEQRISDLESELEKSNEVFEKQQENLDNAIMSDENRAAKQNELNEKKAAAEKVIQDKIQAEKVKQAKWERANNISQAIAGTALAIISATQTKPFIPLGLIAAGTAATMGAIQLASILNTKIPAYEKGGTTGAGLALWGEARPEVAVTPKGDVMLAEKPTISNFEAGTRIYKSVSDYELAMNAKNGGGFSFDYDKMGEKMKAPNIVLDSRGLWGIVSQQNARRTMINRRYSV